MKTVQDVIDFINEVYEPMQGPDVWGLGEASMIYELGKKQGYRDILRNLLDSLNPPVVENDVLSPEDRIPADQYGRTGTPTA